MWFTWRGTLCNWWVILKISLKWNVYIPVLLSSASESCVGSIKKIEWFKYNILMRITFMDLRHSALLSWKRAYLPLLPPKNYRVTDSLDFLMLPEHFVYYSVLYSAEITNSFFRQALLEVWSLLKSSFTSYFTTKQMRKEVNILNMDECGDVFVIMSSISIPWWVLSSSESVRPQHYFIVIIISLLCCRMCWKLYTGHANFSLIFYCLICSLTLV